ncbi:MAG: sulfotransferase [Pseudomonadales bacterium]|nr:sulfotransferase [Pseudomonadales bacterium]
MDNRIIFLGGSPRSGTTLVQNMLDSHPDILGGPEFLHLPDIIALRKKLLDSVSRGWIDIICTTEQVDKQISAFIDNVLIPFADAHGAKYVSEKTPENVLVFCELMELYPQSKFVHVVRDPRAIIASLLKVGKKARESNQVPADHAANVLSAIRHVKRSFSAGFDAVHAQPDQVYTLVYEELVKDPAGEMAKLCEFLGITWNEEMLRPGEKKHLGEAAITVNSGQIWYDQATFNSNPNTDSLEKWKTELLPYQTLMVNRAFQSNKELCKLGYEFSEEQFGNTSNFRGNLSVAWYTLSIKLGGKLKSLFRVILS